MSKKKDNVEDKKPRNCTMIMIWVIMVIISGAVLCCVAGFFFNIFEYQNADNIVITFLGALAAFVVISNYAQMVEIRNKTDTELDKMKKELHETSIKLSEMDKISQRIISSFYVDINRIKLKIENEKTCQDETVLLLNELMVYEGIDDDEIRERIVDVLNGAIHKAAGSSKVAAAVFDIASMVSPMYNKTNDSLGSLFEIGFEIIDMALWKNKPKSSEYGFTMIKRIIRIDNKYREEGKNDLNSLIRKLKEETKIKFVETLINDLDNNDLSWPVFDKDVQEWIDKTEKLI